MTIVSIAGKIKWLKRHLKRPHSRMTKDEDSLSENPAGPGHCDGRSRDASIK